MTINLVELTRHLYPGEIEAGNITFRQPDDDILIDRWSVEGIEKPSEESILAQQPKIENQVSCSVLSREINNYISNLLNQDAQDKQYDDAISFISYANSNNEKWKNEASTFIAWRDSLYNYAYDQLILMQDNKRAIPSLEDFIKELPLKSN